MALGGLRYFFIYFDGALRISIPFHAWFWLTKFYFSIKLQLYHFKFDLPLSGRKEPLYTGSVILLISQSIDSTWLK